MNTLETAVLMQATRHLCDEWKLSEKDRLAILRLDEAEVTLFEKSITEWDLRNHPRLVERIEYLLGIYKMLGALYPDNPQIRAQWKSSKNRKFDRKTPIDVVKITGEPGVQLVWSMLAGMYAH